VSDVATAPAGQATRARATSAPVDWRALLHPKGLSEGPAGALFSMVCVLLLALIFVAEATRPFGGSLGSLTVVPVVGAAWLLQRPLVVAMTTLAVVTRIGLMAAGLTTIPTGVALVVGLLLVALATDLAAERSVQARAGHLRAAGIRELSHLLDTVRRLSASHDADAVVREVILAAARSVQHDRAPSPRAALVRVEGERIRELIEEDEAATRPGYDLDLACAPPIAEAVNGGRAVSAPTARLLPPLRELEEAAGVVATAYAPIRVGGDVYGVLATGLRRGGRFDPSELRLLEAMADLAGLAIANAERLKLERAHLRRVEALERAKGAFLNRASHELRTPLTVLRGYLHLLEDGAFGALSEEMSDDVVPALITSVEEINSLVEGMLVAARLEYGVELELEPLDLREVVRDTVRGVEETFAGEQAPIVVVETPATPVTVLADGEQIATILANLVRNAMKFSPGNSEIRCVVARRGVVGTVSVHDSGPGIPSEQLPRLFTRFGRIDVPGAAGTRGAGLGLYIARELARMHGGDVTVQTQLGVGSAFELSLPLDSGDSIAARTYLSEVAGRPLESAPPPPPVHAAAGSNPSAPSVSRSPLSRLRGA
jgi:signal transduction histidine kinase